ncbi:MAG: hypothetical protein PVJ53_07525 [Desulfobacterales bacterium]|jgi:hypothetical protein
MEFFVAIALLAAAGIITFVVFRKPKKNKPRAATFKCSRCGEKHCQCEQQP